MEDVGYNFNSRQNSRLQMSKDRSRSRSPREWKQSERRVSEYTNDSDVKVRLFVSNLPYDLRWQDLKDIFREKVGSEVRRAELLTEPDGRPSGNGVVEIMGREAARKAIQALNRFEFKGRLMNVREERERDRQRFSDRDFDHGSARGMSGSAANTSGMMGASAGGLMGAGAGAGAAAAVNMMNALGGGNFLGALNNMAGGGGGVNLNIQLLTQLGIDPSTITNQVFVANLDYKVTRSKLEEVFRIAGNVIEVELKTDSEGRSRGMGTVRFEHPMEAVQCIALLNQQVLYDRQIGVRMDKWVDPIMQEIPSRLPSGLKGLGVGFGAGGQPLMNIAQISNMLTLSSLTGQNVSTPSMNTLAGNMNALRGLLGMAGAGLLPGAAGGLSNMPGGGGAATAGLLGSLASVLGAAGAGGLMPGIGAGMSGGGMLGIGDSLGGGGTGSLMGAGPGGSSGIVSYGGGGGLSDSRGGALDDLGSSGIYGMSGGGGGTRYDRVLEYNEQHRDRAMTSYDQKDRSGGDISGRTKGTTSVFVRNLPFSYNWQDLMDKFRICGDVRTAQIKMTDGKSRGMGTVSFYTPEDAEHAVNMMNGVRIDGRQIEVHLDRLA